MATVTEGAKIHYTTDGSAPTNASTTYANAVTVSADTTFTAIAVKEGIEDSPISVAMVTIKKIATTSGGSGSPLSIALSSAVPYLNGYTGTKSNTSQR